MYTLDINFFKKQSIIYFIISILTFIISIIYELFSHNIISAYMMCSCLIPLIFGALISLLIYKKVLKKIPNRISVNFYNASIATITVFLFVSGILEIAGRANKLISIYIIITILLLLISFLTRKIK